MVFVFPYVGLAIDGCIRYRNDKVNGRLFLKNFCVSVSAGIVAYVMLNVAYSPAGWVERMRIVFGPLKDPAIWAPPNQTTGSYLAGWLWTGFKILGYGGTALLVASVVAAPALGRSRQVALLWLPVLSNVVLVPLSAGYFTDSFLSPLPAAVCLPATMAGAVVVERLGRRPRPRVEWVAKTAVVVAVLLAAWAGWMSNRAYVAGHPLTLTERYVTSRRSPAETLYPLTLWPRHPGSTRLAYLGYTVDDRPLSEVMRAPPPDRPRWLFMDAKQAVFLDEFKLKPARSSFWEEGTGYDYRAFEGPESLGYRLAERVRPERPPFCVPWLVPGLAESIEENDVLVYRNPAAP
jgi:hypothetical protein